MRTVLLTVAEYAAASGNTPIRRYVHGPGVDEPIVVYDGGGTGTKRWFYRNWQGSVIAEANTSGTASATYTCGPYGELEDVTGAIFRYTGQVLDAETGLRGLSPCYRHEGSARYYYKARVYSSELGRFLQTDPIGYEDQQNLYAYVGNDPVNLQDPSGKDAIVSRSGNEINIQIGFIFKGSGNTSFLREKVINAVESAYSGQFGRYSVSIDVITDRSMLTRENANQIEIRSGIGRSSSGASNSVLLFTRSNDPKDTFENVAAHEVGHLLGLEDQYDSEGKPFDGEDDIMSDEDNPVNERTINRILRPSNRAITQRRGKPIGGFDPNERPFGQSLILGQSQCGGFVC